VGIRFHLDEAYPNNVRQTIGLLLPLRRTPARSGVQPWDALLRDPASQVSTLHFVPFAMGVSLSQIPKFGIVLVVVLVLDNADV